MWREKIFSKRNGQWIRHFKVVKIDAERNKIQIFDNGTSKQFGITKVKPYKQDPVLSKEFLTKLCTIHKRNRTSEEADNIF